MAKQKKRPEETNLDQLKHLAHVFLELDIIPTKFSPVVVKHPFTDNGVVGIPGKNGELLMVNLLDDPEALQSWKELCSQRIKETDTAEPLQRTAAALDMCWTRNTTATASAVRLSPVIIRDISYVLKHIRGNM